MKESRKQFIISAHEAACSEWKSNIEKEFPRLFPANEIKLGRWIKLKDSKTVLVCPTDVSKGLAYGVTARGEWTAPNQFQGWTFARHPDDWIEATYREVRTALIKEWEKNNEPFENYAYQCVDSVNPNVLFGWNGFEKSNTLFDSGDWYNIEPKTLQLTVAEIEEKYGCKVEVIS